MWGWFTGLTFLKKSLLVGGSLLAVGTAVNATQTPPEPPTAPPQTQSDRVEIKNITEEQPIPFQKLTENDATLEKGKTVLATAGANGTLTITYKVTYTNGIETSREKISEVITQQPVNEVTRIGTKVMPVANCVAGYSPCISPGSDVDCASGSGNGPRYVSGPIYVTGSDPYDLDRDGDGIGCE